MKTKIKEIKQQDKDIQFPCLMIAKTDGAIVLFTDAEEGTLIHKGNAFNSIGEYCRGWDISVFEKFTGKLVLEND